MRLRAHASAAVFALAIAACGRGDVDEGEDAGEPTEFGDTAAAGAPTPDTAPTGGDASVSGQAIYSANCATCHGETGRGEGPAAVGLEPPPADLTDGSWVTGDGSLAAIKNVIENGSPGTAMIGWKGTLSDAELDAVARYVRSLGS